MQKRVYLGGPIDGLTFNEGSDWREYTIEELAKSGIIGVSPLRNRESLRGKGIISGAYDDCLASGKGITRRAKLDVRGSDVLLMNLLGAKKISKGTLIEYGWADAWDKPIVTVMEKRGNVHEYLMIDEISMYRVETLDSGIAMVRAILLP